MSSGCALATYQWVLATELSVSILVATEAASRYDLGLEDPGKGDLAPGHVDHLVG